MYPASRRTGKRTAPSDSNAWLLSTVGALLAVGSAVQAEPVSATLPIITVTSTKKAQSLDSVAGSVTVHGGDSFDSSGVTRLVELEHITPGLSFQPFGQAGVHSPVMRGISAQFFSFSSSTLLLVDGVPTLMAQGFDDALQDIERVEVLRGPQSTLYGRNAQAGVIAVHTRKPGNTQAASASAGWSDRKGQVLRANASRALVRDRLYAGIAGEWSRQDGFISNMSTGLREDDRERRGVKLSLRWTPDADTEATLRYRRQTFDDGAAQWGAAAAPRLTVRSGTPGWNRSSGDNLSLDVATRDQGGLKWRFITAYGTYDDRARQDTDFQVADALHIERDHRFRTFSQEVRLEGEVGGSRWLAGLYADRDDHDLLNAQKLPQGASRIAAAQKGRTAALFTHWTVPLDSRWTAELGARLEHSSVRFTPAGQPEQSAGSRHASPKLALQYKLSTGTQAYATVATGFRTGGFNVFVPAAGHAAYRPEKLKSIEAGIKGISADRRLRFAVAVYEMRMDDMQVQQMPAPGLVYLTNAATGRSSGAELELDWLPAKGWRASTGLALNRARFNRFRDGANVYDGRRNPFAPDLSGHVALRFDASNGWHAQAQASGMGKVYLDAANRFSRNGFGILNLQAGYSWGDVELAAQIRNAGDKRYDAVGFQNGMVTVYSPPREIGARLSWQI